MNTTKYVRSPKNRDPFTKISNSIAKLPAVEAGIMFQILSNSDDWVINKEIVRKRAGLGEEKFAKVWNNLKSLGYISIKKTPSLDGKIQYEYIIYENPEIHNPPSEIEEPTNINHSSENRTTETHTTVNHITVTGGTNNYQVINEAQKTIFSSGSDGLSTKVEVRPGNSYTGPNILDQEKTNEDILQIVPPPQLCFGSVRDNDEDRKQGSNITSPTQALNNTTPIVPLNSRSVQPEDHHGPISSEVCYSRREKISPDTQEILDNLEIISNEDIKDMINVYYTEDYPNWEYLLKKKQLQGFVKETSKLIVPDTLATELLTEYNIRLKKEAYKKH